MCTVSAVETTVFELLHTFICIDRTVLPDVPHCALTTLTLFVCIYWQLGRKTNNIENASGEFCVHRNSDHSTVFVLFLFSLVTCIQR